MTRLNNNPLVTVIMPVYNAEEFLAESIDSILRQTFKDFEFLIINDGSTDNSLSLIRSYEERDHRITVIDQENKGVVASANTAITRSRGEYIARMDADDVSMPERLEQGVHILQKSLETILVCSDFEVIDDKGCFRYREFVPPHDSDIKRALFLRNPIANGSTLIRKSALVDAGLFDDTFAEDFHMWMKLSELGKFEATGTMLYRWRMNPGGLTLSNNNLSVNKGKEYIESRWQKSTPLYVPRGQIVTEARYYYRRLGFYGIDYKETYLNDLTQLSARFFTHGHKLLALRQLFAVASTGRTGLKIALKRIHIISGNKLRSSKQAAPFGRAAYDNQKPEPVE